mmetsp:Transcript_27122/g.78154  ORF Transcript_27122/g.78154 Transcript_27122/m.78154 type:complete len:388 (+) Transcript_27122:208-1371(+)
MSRSNKNTRPKAWTCGENTHIKHDINICDQKWCLLHRLATLLQLNLQPQTTSSQAAAAVAARCSSDNGYANRGSSSCRGKECLSSGKQSQELRGAIKQRACSAVDDEPQPRVEFGPARVITGDETQGQVPPRRGRLQSSRGLVMRPYLKRRSSPLLAPVAFPLPSQRRCMRRAAVLFGAEAFPSAPEPQTALPARSAPREASRRSCPPSQRRARSTPCQAQQPLRLAVQPSSPVQRRRSASQAAQPPGSELVVVPVEVTLVAVAVAVPVMVLVLVLVRVVRGAAVAAWPPPSFTQAGHSFTVSAHRSVGTKSNRKKRGVAPAVEASVTSTVWTSLYMDVTALSVCSWVRSLELMGLSCKSPRRVAVKVAWPLSRPYCTCVLLLRYAL